MPEGVWVIPCGECGGVIATFLPDIGEPVADSLVYASTLEGDWGTGDLIACGECGYICGPHIPKEYREECPKA